MRLSDEVKCRNWGQCDVGKRAQARSYLGGRVFPQDIIAAPPGVRDRWGKSVPFMIASYENWRWEIWLTGCSDNGKKRWTVCPEHSAKLMKSWEEIFRVEVSDYNAYHAYMDRIER